MKPSLQGSKHSSISVFLMTQHLQKKKRPSLNPFYPASGGSKQTPDASMFVHTEDPMWIQVLPRQPHTDMEMKTATALTASGNKLTALKVKGVWLSGLNIKQRARSVKRSSSSVVPVFFFPCPFLQIYKTEHSRGFQARFLKCSYRKSGKVIREERNHVHSND